MARKQDNSTGRQKIALRLTAMRQLGAAPVIMETHGGTGEVFKVIYRTVKQGVVFEVNQNRAALLAMQRPTWAVYEGDCVAAIRAGAGAHLAVNFLDVDPYGDPWPVLQAFFESERPRADRLVVAVNDGLRGGLAIKGALGSSSMRGVIERFGDDLRDIYLDVCQWLMAEKAALAGYRLGRWVGYYCGKGDKMTHYLAVLER